MRYFSYKDTARYWFEKAVDGGCVEGLYNLATISPVMKRHKLFKEAWEKYGFEPARKYVEERESQTKKNREHLSEVKNEHSDTFKRCMELVKADKNKVVIVNGETNVGLLFKLLTLLSTVAENRPVIVLSVVEANPNTMIGMASAVENNALMQIIESYPGLISKKTTGPYVVFAIKTEDEDDFREFVRDKFE